MRKLQLNTHIHWATGTHQRFRGGIIIIIIWHGGGGGGSWPPSLRGTHAHREIHRRVGDHDKWLSRSPPPLSGGRAARVFGQVFGAICQPVRGGGALGERVARGRNQHPTQGARLSGRSATKGCTEHWRVSGSRSTTPLEPSPCIMCATLFSASGLFTPFGHPICDMMRHCAVHTRALYVHVSVHVSLVSSAVLGRTFYINSSTEYRLAAHRYNQGARRDTHTHTITVRQAIERNLFTSVFVDSHALLRMHGHMLYHMCSSHYCIS